MLDYNETNERHFSSTITYCRNITGVFITFAPYIVCFVLDFFMVTLSSSSSIVDCWHPEALNLIFCQPIWPNILNLCLVQDKHIEIATGECSRMRIRPRALV